MHKDLHFQGYCCSIANSSRSIRIVSVSFPNTPSCGRNVLRIFCICPKLCAELQTIVRNLSPVFGIPLPSPSQFLDVLRKFSVLAEFPRYYCLMRLVPIRQVLPKFRKHFCHFPSIATNVANLSGNYTRTLFAVSSLVSVFHYSVGICFTYIDSVSIIHQNLRRRMHIVSDDLQTC